MLSAKAREEADTIFKAFGRAGAKGRDRGPGPPFHRLGLLTSNDPFHQYTT